MRTTRSEVVFRHSFKLKGVRFLQPAGSYIVDTDEEAIGGLQRPIYRRIATLMHVRSTENGANSIELIEINPAELATALLHDRSLGEATLAPNAA